MLVVSATIEVLHITDPGCPWAYSAAPHHAVLQWRYGDQLDWRLALIGLAESGADYDARGYSPGRNVLGWHRTFRPLGMPFDTQPRARNIGTGRACRAIVAARLEDPATELPVFRALQLARFTTLGLFDTDAGIRAALARVPQVGADAILAAIDDPATEAAYQEDRARVRTAAGSPTEFQGKSADTDGAVRYTAPSLLFSRDDRTLEAGGYQPVEAYDVVIANLDTGLERRAPGEDVGEILAAFPYPLTTREVAAVMAPHLTPPDDRAAETALLEAAGAGAVTREPLGDGALWHLT